MQLNTTAALATALISAVIGFGLAFYIERKLSSRMQKKSQKILVSIAMISFGYGLMATLNEVIGFPLQGLHIRYDKLVGLLLVNILVLPIIFIGIARFIGLKNEVVDADLGVQSNPVAVSSPKYILMIAGALSVGYLGYVVVEGGASSSGATYDFYQKVDYNNCNSQFEEKPGFSLKFTIKKETNEIFLTAEFADGREKIFRKLENCSFLNTKNWTCGGELTGGALSPKYMFVDGDFIYVKGRYQNIEGCDLKIVKR